MKCWTMTQQLAMHWFPKDGKMPVAPRLWQALPGERTAITRSCVVYVSCPTVDLWWTLVPGGHWGNPAMERRVRECVFFRKLDRDGTQSLLGYCIQYVGSVYGVNAEIRLILWDSRPLHTGYMMTKWKPNVWMWNVWIKLFTPAVATTGRETQENEFT